MHGLTAPNPDQLLVFVLVLSRVSGLLMTAPIYGTNQVPVRIRAFLAFALALLLTPSQWGAHLTLPTTPVDMLIVMVCEITIGLALGLGVMILFSGIQLAGQIISQMSGAGLADVFNPAFGTSVPLFSELLYLFTLAVFVTIGGHRMVMAGLLGTFATLPPGTSHVSASLPEAMTALVAESFSLGIRAAAPAVTALLIATIVIALIGRAVPQLNVMALGFGVNSLITLFTLSVSLGAIAWIFQAQIDPLLETILDALHGPPLLSTLPSNLASYSLQPTAYSL